MLRTSNSHCHPLVMRIRQNLALLSNYMLWRILQPITEIPLLFSIQVRILTDQMVVRSRLDPLQLLITSNKTWADNLEMLQPHRAVQATSRAWTPLTRMGRMETEWLKKMIMMRKMRRVPTTQIPPLASLPVHVGLPVLVLNRHQAREVLLGKLVAQEIEIVTLPIKA